VNIDWNLSHDEGSTDFSDDETIIEDRVSNERRDESMLHSVTHCDNKCCAEWVSNARKEVTQQATIVRGRRRDGIG